MEAIERVPAVYLGLYSTEPFLKVSVPCNDGYRWRVRAVDGAGNEGIWSDEWDFDLVDQVGPPPPVLLAPGEGAEMSCLAGEPLSVALEWRPAIDPSGIAWYDVALIRTPDYPPTPVTSTLRADGSHSQVVIEGGCGDRYQWRVRAVDGVGNVGQWSALASFRVLTLSESDQEPPPVPVAEGPGSGTAGDPETLLTCSSVDLRWSEVSDPSGILGYRVSLQEYDTTTDQWQSIEPYSIIYDTSMDVSKWLSYGEYRWNVWAIDNAGNHGGAAPWLHFECYRIIE